MLSIEKKYWILKDCNTLVYKGKEQSVASMVLLPQNKVTKTEGQVHLGLHYKPY